VLCQLSYAPAFNFSVSCFPSRSYPPQKQQPLREATTQQATSCLKNTTRDIIPGSYPNSPAEPEQNSSKSVTRKTTADAFALLVSTPGGLARRPASHPWDSYSLLPHPTTSARRPYSTILVTTPEPTVRPPSRIANRTPSSMAIGLCNSTVTRTLSPGMHISAPIKLAVPVTSVVRK
jgi:hypothetical protein